MYVVSTKRYLQHYGIKGMQWGVRKSGSIRIKKGTEVHRMSSVSAETNKGSGYASFTKGDVKKYRKTSALFSKLGMTQFDLTLKAKKDLIGPSKKTRIDVFLKKLKDPKFAAELKRQQKGMFILNLTTPGDVKMGLRNENLSIKKAKAYRMLNAAISSNKKLRKQYLSEFKKLGYDLILDETDATNKVAKAPIIFIERSDSLTFVNADEL